MVVVSSGHDGWFVGLLAEGASLVEGASSAGGCSCGSSAMAAAGSGVWVQICWFAGLLAKRAGVAAGSCSAMAAGVAGGGRLVGSRAVSKQIWKEKKKNEVERDSDNGGPEVEEGKWV
ncbi:hypothetical protein SLA2020_011030 [Shorea laevis]